MLKTFRRNIAVLAGCLTGIVVILVCTVSFLLIRNQYRSSCQNEFQVKASSVYTQWQLEDPISSRWLAANMEVNGYQISLWDNHIPLAYKTISPEQADTILEGMPEAPEDEAFYFTSGQNRCMWYDFSYPHGSRQILVWQDMGDEQTYLAKLAALFLLLAAVSLCAAGVICYFVAHRAMEPVQNALQQQEYFVSAASHELRGPLTVLRTGFGLLEKEGGPPSPHLATMSKEADRMSQLLDNLLILAGGNRLRNRVAFCPVEADTFLIEFADAIEPQVQDCGRELVLELPDSLSPPIPADTGMLEQALRILTDNAMEYAPKGSAIELKLQVTAGRCRFLVVDHGPGIPQEDKTRIFDRFYRGSASRSEPNHFGLGLAVARELVRIQGGKLTVHDTPGGGATFRIELPTTAANIQKKPPD